MSEQDRKNLPKSEEGLSRDGMLETHMQVTDAYREGTLGASVEIDGEQISIPREGYGIAQANRNEEDDEDFPYPTPT
jgi:hypothetical protein